MFTKIRFNNFILPVMMIFASVIVSFIIAQAQVPEISYPVKELGNCKDEIDCRSFCDEKENMIPCINFAEQQGLISKDEAKRAKSFARMGEGPGGCKSKEECEAYCDDNTHIDECLDFAEKNNLIPLEELEEAKKVAKALREGAQMPGGCRGKTQCEAYCDNPEHGEECLAFAEKAGFIPPEELVDAKKAVKAMKSGLKPPGNCRGKKQCDNYCSQPEHMEECFNFAEKAGFIPPEEAENARKIMPLMMRGEMPGGCKAKEQCEVYCKDESHMEECANFALKAGLMKPEDAEMFKKTGGKGPGGCQGKEQCEAFCNDPANQEACMNFAQEHGMIPQEKIQEMKEGVQKLKEGMGMAPTEVQECIKSTVGTEILDKIQSGTLMPGPQIGEQVKGCFEKMMPMPIPIPVPSEGMVPPANIAPSQLPEEFKIPEGIQIPEQFKQEIPQGMMLPEGIKIPEEYKQMIPQEYQQMLPEGMIMPEKIIIPEQYKQLIPEMIMPQQPIMPPPPNILPIQIPQTNTSITP